MLKNFVLVTGASTGIGWDTCRFLSEKGLTVIGTVRNTNDAAKLESHFAGAVRAVVMDVTSQTSVDAALASVTEIAGGQGLLALVNNAGIAVSGPLQFVDLDAVKYQFEVNVLGVLRVTQAFLPLLGGKFGASGPAGKVINISSVSGIISTPFMGPYCMSKYAIESMSDTLRRELSVYGIDVITLQPGPIQTPIWEKARQDSDQQRYEGNIYEPILRHREKIIQQNEADALPVERVSELIYEAIVRKRPATRTIIAKKKWLMVLLTKLPDRIFDQLIIKSLKKGHLGSR